MNRHSLLQADLPRRWKRRIARLNLIWPNTGLDGDLALAVERAPVGRGQHAAHEVVEATGPAGTGVKGANSRVARQAACR
jgi:hypothetical protein